MEDCLFCKIINGEIPCNKVYENEYTLAFLDISPTNPGHTLVVPKKHFKNNEEIDELYLTEVHKTVKKVGRAIKNGLSSPGYNIIINNDQIAGQIIPHFHAHIVPRVEGDGFKHWPGGEYKEGQAEDVAQKITNNIE
ncbi:HIT family protein [Candidatus Parcubacteria bacterium]|nr:MAG: HIT family protein [Candidatus Parcubacteria bacterium]